MSLLPTFIRMGGGPAVLLVACVWHGSEAEGRDTLRRLSGLPGAQLMSATLSPYRDTLGTGEAWPWGKVWRGSTRTLRRLTGEVADRLVDGAATMPRPGSVLFLHDLHGYGARVAPEETAFATRGDHYVAAVAGWSEPGDHAGDAAVRDWAARVSERLAPFAEPGGYVNFLGPDESERVRLSYGATAGRLTAIKRRVDPHDLLRAATGRLGP